MMTQYPVTSFMTGPKTNKLSVLIVTIKNLKRFIQLRLEFKSIRISATQFRPITQLASFWVFASFFYLPWLKNFVLQPK